MQSAGNTEDSIKETTEKVSSTSQELDDSVNLQTNEAILDSVETMAGLHVSNQISETSHSDSEMTNVCEGLENEMKDEDPNNRKRKNMQLEENKILKVPAVAIETDNLSTRKDICQEKEMNKDSTDETQSWDRSADDQKIAWNENKIHKINSCEEMIEESLLKHYKGLRLFGIIFTWLGVHKIYRVILVACRAFINEPITRLYIMSALVMMMAALNAFIKPYKEQTANKTTTISYIANLCIAVLNLVKAHLVAYGCDTSCDHRDTLVSYMGKIEDILLLYVPIVAMGLWVLHTGLQKCLKKCRKQKKPID